MAAKIQRAVKMAFYAVVILAAMLLDNAVFTALHLQYIPTVMPIAVACIGMWEGADTGCVFGLAGGLLWAWSNSLSMYGVWCIIILTVIGTGAGIFCQMFLLQSWKTIFSISAVALFLTDGVYTIFLSVGGSVPADALFSMFLPEGLISIAFVVIFYPVTEHISRIGGLNG